MIQRYIVAITGASGAIYSQRLLALLCEKGYHVNLLISDAGKLVLQQELEIELRGPAEKINEQIAAHLIGKPGCHLVQYIDNRNLMAGFASGSMNIAGMVVLPCSMGSLARMAQGISGNLIERAADVTLKESRPLIIAPRETPLNQIHLKNMLELAKAGASIVPCMPGFYHRPKSINDLVDFVVSRVLNLLAIEHDLDVGWHGKQVDVKLTTC